MIHYHVHFQGSQENDSIINLQLTNMCNKIRYYPIIENQIEKDMVLNLMSPNIYYTSAPTWLL